MKQTELIANDLGTLAEHARATMTATADMAGEKIGQARKGLADTLTSAKEIAVRTRDKAVDCAKVTNQAVHKHPYEAIGIALGAGLILGFLILGRKAHNGN